ncbi:ROK family protein [Neobacillus drentensis]|uniref:ROK family protein n=1 Tax=Neobacillus drentensis TaxID=220684 RepID=UPI003003610A
MHDNVLAFDVGGTYVKAGIIRSDGTLAEPIVVYPSRSEETREELLQHFSLLVKDQGKRVKAGEAIRGIGFAFPGPFEYETGICRIRGLNKFESLYGVNLKEELTNRIAVLPELHGRWSDSPVIAIENDAALFALGECAYGVGRPYPRTICLTIGTGFGSAFVSSNRLVKQGEGVPPEGWLYRLPYRDGIIDDYISRRGIIQLAHEMGIKNIVVGDNDVKCLAERAYLGEVLPVQLFCESGERIKEILKPFIQSFQPDAILIGGQIAKSADLFNLCQIASVPVRMTTDLSVSALKGVYQLFQKS